MLEKFKESVINFFSHPDSGVPANDYLDGETWSPYQKEVKSYFDTHKVSSLLPYESYDEETRLFYNVSSFGFVLECPPLLAADEQTENILNELTNYNFPTGTGVQYMTYGSPNILPYLRYWADHRSREPDEEDALHDGAHPGSRRGSNIYRQLARRRVQYYLAGSRSSLFKDVNFILRHFRCFISVTFSREANAANVREVLNIREAVVGILNSLRMTPHCMSADDFVDLLDDIINQKREIKREPVSWDRDMTLARQVDSPETCLLAGRSGLAIGELNAEAEGGMRALDVRCMSVKNYPQKWALWGMSELIGSNENDYLRIPCPFLWTYGVYYPDTEAMRNDIHFRASRAKQKSESMMARLVPNLQDQNRDWQYVLRHTANGETLLWTYHQLVLFAEPGQGNVAEESAKSIFKSNNWGLQRDSFIQVQAFMSALPMMLDKEFYGELKKLGRMRRQLTNNIANMLPLFGEWRGTGTPKMMLVGRRGQISFWDNFDTEGGNYNIAIAAESGNGKSFFALEFINNTLSLGGRAIVIDKGGSYRNYCQMKNGTYIEFTDEAEICINPFTNLADYEEAVSVLKPLIAVMAAPNRKDDWDWEYAAIERAIQSVWHSRGNQATVSDVAEVLLQMDDKRATDIGEMLYPYTRSGVYAKYFEGACNLDFSNELVVLEMDELENLEELQRVMLLIIMYVVTDVMYKGDRDTQKICLIDEAWELMSGDNSAAAKFIEKGYRRARKYNGCFATIVQGINDYYRTAVTRAAKENSGWSLYLGQKDQTIEQLERDKRITMDPYKKRLIKSLRTVSGKYSELMIEGENGYAVQRLITEPFTHAMFSTRAADHTVLRQYQASGGMSLAEAIQALADESHG